MNCFNFRYFLLQLTVSLVFASSLAAQDVYVSKSGNDSNPGTKEKPVATLEAARDLVRQYKAIHDLPNGSILKRLSPEAGRHAVQVNLKALGINEYGQFRQYGHAITVSPAPLELFFNNEAMPLAHYPNEGDIKIGKVLDKGSVPRIRDYSGRGAIFEYTDPRHKIWAGQKDIWFQGTFNYGYSDDNLLVQSIDVNEHLFEYNHIHHVTLNSNDTSPWYIGRDPSDRGNVVRYNYLDHCGNPDRMNMGIYCDDSSTGVTVYGNVFYKMNTNHGVLFSNSGWDLKMRNNIIVDPGFVDLSKQNFNLRPDSKVFQQIKGFEPVPFDQMGLFIDEYRKKK